MKNTQKLSEAAFRNKVYEMVKKNLSEFRGDGFFSGGGDENDGDYSYVRPNGDINTGTGLQYINSHPGKRSKSNKTIGGSLHSDDGELTYFSHGKGRLCFEVINLIDEKMLDGKIDWSDDEMSIIKSIKNELHDLASLTKKEGNKKRGYDGPEDIDSEVEQ